jgi:membrane protein involved in colicin uptake
MAELNNINTTTTDENTDTNTQAEESKTYTEEEVNRLLQAEVDRRISAAMKKAQEKQAQAVAEAQKLAKMSAQEQYEYQLQQKEKELNERAAQLAILENKTEASKILAQKGLSLDLVDFVVAEDAETMMANIKALEEAFKASVKAEVEKRLNSTNPKKNLGSADTLTKADFLKKPISFQQAFYNQNPELYQKLMNS